MLDGDVVLNINCMMCGVGVVCVDVVGVRMYVRTPVFVKVNST